MEPQIGHPSADSGTPQIRSSERRGKDPKRSLSRLKPYAPFFALIVLSLLVGAMNPRFFEFSNLIRIANSAAIPLVLALGYDLHHRAGQYRPVCRGGAGDWCGPDQPAGAKTTATTPILGGSASCWRSWPAA